MKQVNIKCAYGNISGLCWGSGNKQKILALHGWLDNAASFHKLAPKLAKLGYEVIAIDFAGHGHSDHRAEGHFCHFIDFVLEIQDVLIQLQWSKPILLGHSMGAAMAQMYAATCPEKIEKLIMIENIGPVPSYQPGSAATNLKQALKLWKNHTTEHKRYFPDIDSALKARQTATPMKAEILKPLVERGLKKTSKGYHWRTDKRLRLRSLFRFTEKVVEDMLMADKPKTQLILAQPSTYALSYPSVTKRIKKLNPQQYKKIKGQHHLHMDQAQLVFEAIKPFLRDLSCE